MVIAVALAVAGCVRVRVLAESCVYTCALSLCRPSIVSVPCVCARGGGGSIAWWHVPLWRRLRWISPDRYGSSSGGDVCGGWGWLFHGEVCR